MKKFNFKRVITMGIAAVIAVSAMSISAFAAYDDIEDFGEPIATGYRITEDGKFEWYIPSLFGITNPPSNIVGSNTKYYLYDADNVPPTTHTNTYINQAAEFSFYFNKSCTTRSKQYAEFIIGGPFYNNASTNVNFKFTGSNECSNNTEYVNLKLVSTGSAADIDLGQVMVHRNRTSTVSTTKMAKGALYYVLVTPASNSVGHIISGDVTIGR